MSTSTIASGQPPMHIDGRAFAEHFAERPFSVAHSLVDHPLLTLDAIAELADEMPPAAVERHPVNLPVFMPGGAPEVEGSPSDTVRGIETNGLLHVLGGSGNDRACAEFADDEVDHRDEVAV